MGADGSIGNSGPSKSAGFQYNDDGTAKGHNWGKPGTSFASNIASVTASYDAGGAPVGEGVNKEMNGVFAGQVGRAANVITASLLGDANAVNAYRTMTRGFNNFVGKHK